MPIPTHRLTLWTIFLTLTMTYGMIFVAKILHAEQSTQTPKEGFPPLQCAIDPFGFAVNWGAMKSDADLSRSYCHINPKEFILPPPYDIATLQTPMASLHASPHTQSEKEILTMKLFYSTRHFGTYDLDSDEYVSPDHPGIDLKMPTGTPVHAIAGGVVHSTDQHADGLGNMLIIEHHLPTTREKVYSIYGHLNQILVHRGQTVSPGTLIGTIGTTGDTSNPHLHLQIDRDRGLLRHIPYIPPIGTSIEQANRWTIHPMEFIENY